MTDFEIAVNINEFGDIEHLNRFMREAVLAELKPGFYKFKVVKIKEDKARTLLQNRAMHLFFTNIRKKLNDAGLWKRKVFALMRDGFDIPWSDASVKEDLWLPWMKATTKKTRTRDLEKKEVSEIYEVFNNFTCEKLGFSEPFPSMDSMLFEQELEQRGR